MQEAARANLLRLLAFLSSKLEYTLSDSEAQYRKNF
jgi:hypothetical protein